jgi:hypothetical protein
MSRSVGPFWPRAGRRIVCTESKRSSSYLSPLCCCHRPDNRKCFLHTQPCNFVYRARPACLCALAECFKRQPCSPSIPRRLALRHLDSPPPPSAAQKLPHWLISLLHSAPALRFLCLDLTLDESGRSHLASLTRLRGLRLQAQSWEPWRSVSSMSADRIT